MSSQTEINVELDRRLTALYWSAEDAVSAIKRLFLQYPKREKIFQDKGLQIIKTAHFAQNQIWEIAFRLSLASEQSELSNSIDEQLKYIRKNFQLAQKKFYQSLVEFETDFPGVLQIVNPQIQSSISDQAIYQPTFVRFPLSFIVQNSLLDGSSLAALSNESSLELTVKTIDKILPYSSIPSPPGTRPSGSSPN
ncbi:hypothetical protein [Coleofasciculus sp. FACHB-542]|uniref:hypothetical protein n=1 Tax=Coleofasciculus sp. FACHB-542 TaxID=2692787 RepID=UPI00168604C4|nr:hypothetical protein [Coleofasciculus sp. FACHB-542]MBD2085820.1 hypothetical protein [Coleofasciculus sp. FACHB-542]